MAHGSLIDKEAVRPYQGPFQEALTRLTTVKLMAAAFGVALAMVLVIRLVEGPGQRVDTALRATARWSFIWFWLATTGHALTTLFGANYRTLAQRGRDLGLAFASAHLVHVGLVAWILCTSVKPFPPFELIFFGVGIFWTYLLALLSIRRLSAMLHSTVWRVVRTIGVEYIAFAFLVVFAKNLYQDSVLNFIAYVPFQVMAVAGPLLRIAAAAKRTVQTHRLVVSSR